MNERIRELAEQAYCMAFDEADDKNFLDHHMEMFAELIVRECVDIVGDYYGQGKKSGPGYTMICEIKQHFGVEE
jgi:hypothetical protein